MRIVVNDIVAVPGSGGVFSVLEDFYNEVLEYNKTHNDVYWVFILANKYFEETDQIKIITMPNVKKSWLRRLDFEFVNGYKTIEKFNPNIYLSLQNTMTMKVKNCKKWVYLHQSLPYQNDFRFSFFKKNERKLWVYSNLVGKVINFTLAKSGTNIMVQSEWMKKALINKGITYNSKISVIPPNNIQVERNEKSSKMNMSTFFYPATGMVYKNHSVLFNAARILEKQGYGFNIICTITDDEAESLNLPRLSSIKLVGRVSRDEVLKQYKKSVLVFPSLTETFGLPMLEAKLSNGFIIAGNTDYGNEILKNYPNKCFFDPHSAEDLANEMKKCLDGDFHLKRVDPDKNSSHGNSIIDEILKYEVNDG